MSEKFPTEALEKIKWQLSFDNAVLLGVAIAAHAATERELGKSKKATKAWKVAAADQAIALGNTRRLLDGERYELTMERERHAKTIRDYGSKLAATEAELAEARKAKEKTLARGVAEEARADAAESALAQEREAHAAIATICFKAGADTPDGTSVGAVKALAAKLGDECQARHAIVARCEQAEAALPVERKAHEETKHAFKNFHRMLCARFGYGHDEIDWKRDQVSLEEAIAAKLDSERARADGLERAAAALLAGFPALPDPRTPPILGVAGQSIHVTVGQVRALRTLIPYRCLDCHDNGTCGGCGGSGGADTIRYGECNGSGACQSCAALARPADENARLPERTVRDARNVDGVEIADSRGFCLHVSVTGNYCDLCGTQVPAPPPVPEAKP